MQGLHLTADLYQCRCEDAWLTDAQRLGDWCLRAVADAGLQPMNHLFQPAPGMAGAAGGISAAVLLAGSHICLHTWPGQRAVTADVYLSNADGANATPARVLMDALLERFQPEWTEQRSLDRGDSQ